MLSKKDIEMRKVEGGYYFKTNVTFEEIVNATGRDFNLLKDTLGMSDLVNITTNSGYVEAKIRGDGMPYWINEHFDLTIYIKNPFTDEVLTMDMTLNETTEFRNINGDIVISVPEGIQNAEPLESVLG